MLRRGHIGKRALAAVAAGAAALLVSVALAGAATAPTAITGPVTDGRVRPRPT